MKYTVETDINVPIDRVIELFDNEENLKKWMMGLESTEHLSGEKGQVGAKTKMIFNWGKRKSEMIETITSKDLPDDLSGTYEMNGTLNIQKNSFQKLNEHSTRWVSHAEFQFSGLGMKIMAALMPGLFKKQSRKFADSFKEFAESNA